MNHPKVGVAVFVWKDDKFLMMYRIGKHGKNSWSIPGGHLEFNESWEEAAKREAMEEAGIEIDNVRFLAATNDIFTETGKHYVSIWTEADWVSGEPTITEPDILIDHQWRDFKDLPAPLFEPCWTNLRVTRPELFA